VCFSETRNADFKRFFVSEKHGAEAKAQSGDRENPKAFDCHEPEHRVDSLEANVYQLAGSETGAPIDGFMLPRCIRFWRPSLPLKRELAAGNLATGQARARRPALEPRWPYGFKNPIHVNRKCLLNLANGPIKEAIHKAVQG